MVDLADVVGTQCVGLSPRAALERVRDMRVPVFGVAKAGEVLAYLASVGALKRLKKVANDDEHPLQDAAEATLTTLRTREGFDFALPAVRGMLTLFVDAGIFAAEDAQAVLALGTSEALAFASVSLKDVIAIMHPDWIAHEAVESLPLAVTCARYQGALVSATVSGVPAETMVELHVASSLDNENFTAYKYAGAIPVDVDGVFVASVAPQVTGLYNRIKLLSREYRLRFDQVSAAVY